MAIIWPGLLSPILSLYCPADQGGVIEQEGRVHPNMAPSLIHSQGDILLYYRMSNVSGVEGALWPNL